MQNYARITISLSTDEYRRLAASAQQDLRTGREQARWLLRQALGIAENQQVESTDHAKSGTTVRQDLVGATL